VLAEAVVVPGNFPAVEHSRLLGNTAGAVDRQVRRNREAVLDEVEDSSPAVRTVLWVEVEQAGARGMRSGSSGTGALEVELEACSS
jgi:hypothetical protein